MTQDEEIKALESRQRGKRFEFARQQSGLDMRQTSTMSHIHVDIIYGIENGVIEPMKNLTSLLAETYGVAADWLMHGTRTELDPALTAELSKLSPDDQQRVAELLSILRKD